MSGIRVTYSGLISFAVGVTSVVTGLIFTIIVTRRLTPEEFGTWNLIGGLITYVLIVEPAISYWATREIARGVESGKTVALSSATFSAIGLLVYITIAYFVAPHSGAKTEILFFASILIPAMFLNRTLTAINLGFKPHAASYGTLGFEATKIPAGLVFVYFFNLGITGAILSTFAAYVCSNILLFYYARERTRVKFAISHLFRWLKLSWLPLISSSSSLIFSLDVLIFSVITGSVVGLAYYSVTVSVTQVIAHSGLISRALYPKLLASDERSHLKDNLTRVLYFAIPLTAMALTFAKPALFVLKPIYIVAAPVVVFMALRAFFYTLSSTFSNSLQGIEKVDITEGSKFLDYVKSKLFLLPALQLGQYGLYAGVLALVVFTLKPFTSVLDLVLYWSIVSLGTQLPFSIYHILLMKKGFVSLVDRKSVSKYLIVGIGVFGACYLLTDKLLNYNNNIYRFLPDLLLLVGIALGGYILLTYIGDSRTRILIKSIINEMKNKGTKD